MIARCAGMSERQQKLASEYLPFARALARPFKTRVPSAVADFESAACLGLIEAAIRFHPNQHANFATYARRRITGALVDAWRGMRQLGYRFNSKQGPIQVSIDDLSRDQESAITVEPNVEDDVAYRDTLERWIECFPENQKRVFRSIYLDGRSQNDTAKELDLSKSYVSHLHAEGIAALSARPDVIEAGLESGYF